MATESKERKTQAKITPPKEEYFMGLLFVFASMCKDPYGQEAALIVDSKDRPVTFGVNFLAQPEGYQSKKLTWNIDDRQLGMTTAAEAALERALKLYSPGICEPFTSHIMYLTGPPCLRVVRESARNGMKTIIYGPLRSKLFNDADFAQAADLAERYKLTVRRFSGNLGWLRDRVWSLSDMFHLF